MPIINGKNYVLKVCGDGFRSHHSPQIKYPTKPGSVIKVKLDLFRANYNCNYGIHCFGGDWHLVNNLPCIAWRTHASSSPCALVLEIGLHRVSNSYRVPSSKKPYSCVTVTHIVAQSTKVCFAGTIRGCKEWMRKVK